MRVNLTGDKRRDYQTVTDTLENTRENNMKRQRNLVSAPRYWRNYDQIRWDKPETEESEDEGRSGNAEGGESRDDATC
ncbi:MAG: hypothetical protein GWN93_11720 [Deltaproteobacteria bacterium]|nr:hypothetical protein [Deltaproteobacteria bacterium]